MTQEFNACYSNLFAFELDIKNILNAQIIHPDSLNLISDSIFLLYRSGHIQPAESLLESLILILEKKVDEAAILERCYTILAKIQFYNKKYFECLSTLNKSLSINNLNSETFFILGNVYRELNLKRQMLDSYFKGMKINFDLKIAYELSKELITASKQESRLEFSLIEKFKTILLSDYSRIKFNSSWFIQAIDQQSTKIPKIIHRVWLGKNPIPKTYEGYFEEWKKLHPEWDFYTWYDRDIEDFVNYNKIQEASTYAGKADIARYEILYRYGGVYLDCDIKLLKPLDNLLEDENYKFIVSNEDESFQFHCSNSFIASVPGFCVLSDAINRIKELDVNSYQPNVSTGPLFFRQCLGYELNEINLLPTDIFYPYLYNEPIEILNLIDLNNTYGIHFWSGSWKNTENKDNHPLDLEQLLAAYIRRLQRIKGNIYFVVIGANDGIQNDSLTYFIRNNNNWEGVFVEPLPDIFFRLVLNYYQFQDRLRFENSAISDESISTSINRVKPIAVQRGDVSDWAYGIASLHKDKNAIEGYSSGKLLVQKMDESTYNDILENTIRQEIKCIRFQDLVEKYNIAEIDVIQIDCEGHDYKVFQQIDLNVFKPFFIKVEVCNLTKDEFKSIVDKLILHNYIIYRTTTDLYCFKKLGFSQQSIDQTNTNDILEAINGGFQLEKINLIIFPKWQQVEELLYQDLVTVLKYILTLPNNNRVTLLIDSSNISYEDANFIISSIIMDLLQQEDLDIFDEEPEISLLGELNEVEWKTLLQQTQARIVLQSENEQVITKVGAENIPSINLEQLESKKISFKFM